MSDLKQSLLDYITSNAHQVYVRKVWQQFAPEHSIAVINSALDSLTIDDMIERTEINGDAWYKATGRRAVIASVEPPQPKQRPANQSTSTNVPTRAMRTQVKVRQAVMKLLQESPDGLSGPTIIDKLDISQTVFSCCIRALERGDVVTRSGPTNKLIYALKHRPTTESKPALSKPDAQPIDASKSTAAPAAPADLPGAVKEPAGPRHGPSSNSTPDAVTVAEGQSVQQQPAAAATQKTPQPDIFAELRKAVHRAQDRRPPAVILTFPLPGAAPPPEFGDINDLISPTPVPQRYQVLPEPRESEPADVVNSLHITQAKYALWSDGSFEIDAGDHHMTFSKTGFKALIDYLDQVCAIDIR